MDEVRQIRVRNFNFTNRVMEIKIAASIRAVPRSGCLRIKTKGKAVKRIGAISEFVFAYSKQNIHQGRKIKFAAGSALIIICAPEKAADDTVMAVQWVRLSFFGRSGFAADCRLRAFRMFDWMYARKNISSNTAM